MGRRKKRKNPHPSKRIHLGEPPSSAKPPDTTKLRVLATFNRYTPTRLNIRAGRKKGAPKFQDYTCTAAWNVITPNERLNLFTEVADKLGNTQELYHGTPESNIAQIVKKGLHTGQKSCLFGSGVYLGSPAKAFSYTGCHEVAYLLKVRAVLGQVKECSQSDHNITLSKLQTEGYNSVAGVAGVTSSWAGTLRHNENVVYSPDQVVVTKIYEYQRIETPPPQKGTCALVVDRKRPLRRKERAFADILNQSVCGNTAYVQVLTERGEFWVCNHCLKKGKIKTGSKIKVHSNHWRQTGNWVVRIKGIVNRSE